MTDASAQSASRFCELPGVARATLLAYLSLGAVVVIALMIVGAIMRFGQAYENVIGPDMFYQLMTVHGVGFVGVAALMGAAIMWRFLRQYVALSTAVLVLNLITFLAGVALMLGAVFLGRFAGAWTFLYPLPAVSQGAWAPEWAIAYLWGLLVVGVGFLILFLDSGRAILAKFGSPWRALGWPSLFGKSADAPPPAVVASMMVVIVTTLCLVAGAGVIVASLANLYSPAITIDPLLAKNITYFFGHTFINATIYMAVVAVYEILPRYTGRPWKASRLFLGAWTASTIMVLLAFPHHLMMDFVMPTWMLVAGQIFSYMNGLPILVVTGYAALTYVYRSGIQWDLTSSLLFVSMFGWAAGVIPAILDATIVINYVMHNTLWVPGHFHFYLLLGLLPMIFGFMSFLAAGEEPKTSKCRASFWAYVLGALGFAFVFLYAGRESVPRRWAVHLPEWMVLDRIGAAFAVIIVLAALVFAARFLASVPRLMAPTRS